MASSTIEQELIAVRRFRYIRVGHDERALELLPDHAVGRGRAGYERWWRIDPDGRLAIGGPRGTTCVLSRGGDGVWRGRWLRFERMPIELVPAPSVEPDAGDPAATPAEPIDLVYTWVDAGDPGFQAALASHRRRSLRWFDPASTGARRFRDNDELKFSLRSAERFIPWVRHIYLVTNGQVPAWLDRGSSRLRLVRHDEIFPAPEHLPTFNSFAIEMHLHRIPGLSSRFLYLNDDMFIGAPVRPDNLFDADGRPVIFWDEPARVGAVRGRGSYARATAYTLRLLDDEFGEGPRHAVLPHAPRLFDRAIIEDVQARWHAAVVETSAHRFRTGRDVVWHLLYFNYLLAEPRHRDRVAPRQLVNNGDYAFVMLTKDLHAMQEKFVDVTFQQPTFLCFNDNLDSSAASLRVLAELRRFLECCYPEPSSFERQKGR